METFLPSEIGRLIYGYLGTQCGDDLANEFLNSCDVMEECRIMKQKYLKKFDTKIQDLALEDILNRYSVLCSKIFQNTKDEPTHKNILQLLKNILDSSKVITENFDFESNNFNESNKIFEISNKQNCKTDNILINRNIIKPDIPTDNQKESPICNKSNRSKISEENHKSEKRVNKCLRKETNNCDHQTASHYQTKENIHPQIHYKLEEHSCKSDKPSHKSEDRRRKSEKDSDRSEGRKHNSEERSCKLEENHKSKKPLNKFLRIETNNSDHQNEFQSFPENENKSDELLWDHKMRQFVPSQVKPIDSEEKKESGEDSKLKKKKKPIRKRKTSDAFADKIAELKKKKKSEVQEQKLLNAVPKESINSENVDKSNNTGLAATRRRRSTKNNINGASHNISNDRKSDDMKKRRSTRNNKIVPEFPITDKISDKSNISHNSNTVDSVIENVIRSDHTLVNETPKFDNVCILINDIYRKPETQLKNVDNNTVSSDVTWKGNDFSSRTNVFKNNNQQFENVDKNVDISRDMNVINNVDKINDQSEKMHSHSIIDKDQVVTDEGNSEKCDFKFDDDFNEIVTLDFGPYITIYSRG